MATVHVALPDGFREKLKLIAADVRRLRPDYQNPERYHLAKDEIVHAIMKLAGER